MKKDEPNAGNEPHYECRHCNKSFDNPADRNIHACECDKNMINQTDIGMLPLCAHEFESTDQQWASCKHCGMIKPNLQC